MIITIDGPSGTGKTTVAKKVAEALHISYFDTGAMYRAVTWALLKEGIDLSDERALSLFLDQFSFRIEERKQEKRYFANGHDVTSEIRYQNITDHVSKVASLAPVREKLWNIQRSFGAKESAVFEGRDMGSVVFPDAEMKIYLTATAEIRGKRRLEEIQLARPDEAAQFDQQTMKDEINRRDHLDSTRKLAPLVCPEDAYLIDTSNLSIDQVVQKILIYEKKVIKKMSRGWLYCKTMKPFYRFILCLAWSVFRLFYRHKVFGLEHYYPGAGILAANHISYLDPPIVAISWPEEVHFLAKESLFKPFLFGNLIRALNSHPVKGEVGDISVFKMMIQLLKEGKKIILFPEGLRSESGRLEPLKPGVGLLVSKANAAVIPTYIHGPYEIWNVHRKIPKLFGRTACVFGRPIFWESFAHLDRKEAQAALTEALTHAIQNLRAWYEQGAKGSPP